MISNVSIVNNSFEIGKPCNPKTETCPTIEDLLDTGPSCCKVRDLVLRDNVVVMKTDDGEPGCHPVSAKPTEVRVEWGKNGEEVFAFDVRESGSYAIVGGGSHAEHNAR